MKVEIYKAESEDAFTMPAAIPHLESWTGKTLSREDFFMPIPSEAMAELDEIAAMILCESPETLNLTPSQFRLDNCREYMTTVKEVLDEGPGVALIDRLPIQEYSRPVATAVYWVLGSLLGRPVAQNWEGLMLYDVRNTGKTHGDGVRGSVTNVELFYHTDNSYGLMPPQYIGLLCLQTAKTGGESRLINWAEVLKRLQAKKPHLVDRGFQNFLFERQKEHAPGAPAVLSKPVFKSNGKDINVCYSSRLMRTGYRMAEQDLDDAGKEFLDVVDEIISRNDIQLKMYIEQGQIQFINNARIGHSRSEFSDYDEPGLMRHLVRLWFREHGNTNYDG